jgi:hypothetical protein
LRASQREPLYSEKSVWLVHRILYFSLNLYKLCRHVLTPSNNSQLLFKWEILDKLRLVTFHTTATQRKCNVITGSYQFRRNQSSHDLDSQCQNEDAHHAILSMLLSPNVSLLLCETISLSQLYNKMTKYVLFHYFRQHSFSVEKQPSLFVEKSAANKKRFVTFRPPGVNVIKLFSFVTDDKAK